MLVIDPKQTPTRDLHQFLLGSVAPRPIAFVSTVDAEGRPNLAPYSFFNAFSSNPPILVFSSNRRVENNTTKDTLANVRATGEVVINMVNYAIVRQMAVTSVQFESGVSEFGKAGLTPIASDLVRPFRVKESPVHLECRVKEVLTLGEHGGAGHLVICEVLRMHIDEGVVDERNRIDPHKIDLMGRMGRAYYVRASGDAVHTIVQSVTDLTIGYDHLPEQIRHSKVLSGNNLGQLAGLTTAPTREEALALRESDERVRAILGSGDPLRELHEYARELLDADDRKRSYAAKVAWLGEFL
ncbi:MAG: flavin reductase family protein [Saprospiraceae bacterium]|nr:flavin reductase family protein [Saprospiraceae bacterium]MCB0682099.1 flavin reductase family protein [Saprospiraceae bacterium]